MGIPTKKPENCEPVRLPMSTSYWAGTKFANTSSLLGVRDVMSVVLQVGVAVSDTNPKELDTRVATPTVLSAMESEDPGAWESEAELVENCK